MSSIRQRAWLVLFLFGLLLVAAACGGNNSQGEPQPPLPEITLRLHGSEVIVELRAEVAATAEQQAMGLMFRRDMARDAGMLFLFDPPRQASFWMKNTYLPLDIAYIHEGGRILEIHTMVPHDESPVRSRSREVAYALEVNRGWFAENNIRPGDRVEGLPGR